MPKVTEAHRASRRTQIVEAAMRCFAERGFQRTSMADIIEASGLSAGAIYLQFESKQQIAVAAARLVVGHRREDIIERLAREPLPEPDELIAVIMSGLRRELRDSRLLLQMWAEAVAEAEMSAVVIEILDSLREQFREFLYRWALARRGMAETEARAWSQLMLPVLLGLSQGYIVQSALLPDFDAETYFAGMRELFR